MGNINFCKDCIRFNLCKFDNSLPMFDENQEVLCKGFKNKARIRKETVFVSQNTYHKLIEQLTKYNNCTIEANGLPPLGVYTKR